MPLSFVHRFADRDGQDAALDRLFGTSRWREVESGPERPAKLLAMFREQLVKAGLRFTGAFRLKPPDGSNEYWIVGASGHKAGYESIKEGFWAADPRHGTGFTTSKRAPEGQQSLGFEEPQQGPDTGPLLSALRERFGSDWFTVEEALEFTHETPFLQRQVRTLTLVPAERDGVLQVDRPAGARRFAEGRGIRMRFV